VLNCPQFLSGAVFARATFDACDGLEFGCRQPRPAANFFIEPKSIRHFGMTKEEEWCSICRHRPIDNRQSRKMKIFSAALGAAQRFRPSAGTEAQRCFAGVHYAV